MANARLIIHNHRDDHRWAKRLRGVAAACPDLTISGADEGGAAPEQGDVAPKHIHICSPSYASKPRALDWGEHVALIVAGQPGASAFEGASDEECLPRALSEAPRIEARTDLRDDKASPNTIACEAVAAALGVAVAHVKVALWRRRAKWGGWGVLAALGIAGMVYGLTAIVDHRTSAKRATTSDVAVTAATEALDVGDDAAAYAALARAAGSGAPSARGVVALERALQETRLLADLPAPATDITGLSFLPGGVLAATSANGGAWLVDPGTGEASQISAPSPNVVARLSPTGDRLWTARPGTPALDETGAEYVPLAFIDIDLAEAEQVTETVIRAPIGRLSEGAISPDGALFAADIGPGAGAETVIAAFRRGSQSLAGALRLPSDRASLRFVGPDRILATINPPGIFGQSPGLFLWRVGAETPLVLRPKGLPPICGKDAANADPKAIRQAQEQGDLPVPQVLAAPNGGEIALLLPRLGRGACLLRWRVPTGEPLETIVVPGKAVGAEILAEGGPYLIRRKGRPATVLHSGAPAITLTACRDGAIFPLSSPPGGRASAFLCADGSDGVVASPAGAVWRRRMHEGGVSVVAQGPRARLATAGNDGRLRLWDGAARWGLAANGVRGEATFAVVAQNVGEPRIATLSPRGDLHVLKPDGQATGVSVKTGLAEAEMRVLAPGQIAVLGKRGERTYLQVIDLMAGEMIAEEPQKAGARFMSGAAIIVDDGLATQVMATETGQSRRTFLSIDGARSLADIAVAKGARVLLKNGVDNVVTARVSGRGAAHEHAFAGRGGKVRLSPSGDTALVRVEGAAAPHDDEFFVLDMATGQGTLVPDAAPVSGWFGFSASGDAFAIKPLDPTAEVSVFQTSDGKRIGAIQGGRTAPIWAPNSDLLVSAKTGHVTVTEVRGGRVNMRCTAANTPPRYLAFLPDGGAVVAGARSGGISVLDVQTCATRLRVPDIRVSAAPFAPTPNVIWVPTKTGVSIVPLGADVTAAQTMVARRARALAATK